MILRAALDYASRGWPVIPLVLGGKAPMAKLVPNGVEHATCDPEVITYFWLKARATNIGIATRDLLVVDSDPRNGGDLTLAALFAQHGEFTETPTARTGGGGMHYLFNRPALPLLSKPAPGVDLVHGRRRYIVAAPSIHASGRKYEWTVPPTAPLADAPEWLIAMARRPVAPASATGAASSTSEEKEKRARPYVATCAPALSGQGGHSVTFRTCMRVARGFALSESQAFAVLSAWNQTCKPPWSERELKHKIKQALEVGDYPWGKLLNQTKGRAP